MLRFVEQNLFDSHAQTLVNTVNTVGVMGKGIAKEFKSRYPGMFREYKHYCDQHLLIPGALHVWRGGDRWVLNFPTKTTWRMPSKLEHIDLGLHTFVANYTRLGIKSVSFPPLGCGNGNLKWSEVKPLMTKHLSKVDIPVWVHELFVGHEFNPEQLEDLAKTPPATFAEFMFDVRAAVSESRGFFKTWGVGASFCAEIGADGELLVYVDHKVVLDEDFLAIAWVNLKLGLLTPEALGCGDSSPHVYIMAILDALPYVKKVAFEEQLSNKVTSKEGLMFNQASVCYETNSVEAQ